MNLTPRCSRSHSPSLLLLHLGERKINQGKQDGSLLPSYRKKEQMTRGFLLFGCGGVRPLFWCHRPDLIHPSYSGRNGDSHLSSLWAEVPDYKLEVLFGSWVFVLQEGFALDNVKHLSVKQVTSEKKTSPKHISSSAPTEPRNIPMQFSISSPSPAPPPATAKPPG